MRLSVVIGIDLRLYPLSFILFLCQLLIFLLCVDWISRLIIYVLFCVCVYLVCNLILKSSSLYT